MFVEQKRILAIILSSLILLSGWLSYQLGSKLELQQAQDAFANLAMRDATVLFKAIEASVHTAEFTSGLFKASENVTADEFAVFTQAVIKTHPELQAIEWAPLIRDADRVSFVKKQQARHKNFTLKQSHPDGKLVPASKRPVYYPVTYFQPEDGNLQVLGFDLGSETQRLHAIETARDSSRPFISKKISLVQSSSHAAGFLVIVPVYKKLKAKTVYAHRESLLGFVISAVNIERLIKIHLESQRNNLAMAQVSQVSQQAYLATSDGVYDESRRVFHIASPVANRYFKVSVQERGTGTAFMFFPILLAMLTIALTTTVIVLIIHSYNRQSLLEALVDAKTREIERNNLMLLAVEKVQRMFISEVSQLTLFEGILESFLKITDSQYGFVGRVHKDENNQPFLRTHAISNIAWNFETRQLYEETYATGMEFRNLNTLFGRVMVTGKPFFTNEPGHCPHAGGVPEGHPAISAFLGLPLYANHELIGMVALANRAGGYSQEIIEQLQLLLSTTGLIMFEHEIRIDKRQALKKNYELATTDNLTGIYSRNYFYSKLDEYTELARRSNKYLAVLYIDLDNFKSVNDNYGHAAGDKILKNFATILTQTTRKTDVCCRLGGDEFVVILPNIKSRKEPEVVAEKILKALELCEEMQCYEELPITLSMGVAIYPSHAEDIDDVIQLADAAMYEAKRIGKNRFIVAPQQRGATE